MEISKQDLIVKIKKLLSNIGDGEISTSAYDTAWVARIPSKDNKEKPMFPKCLEWLIDNQLTDGSWGAVDYEYFHDRVINTLSAILTLKLWGENQNLIEKGSEYINKHLKLLSTEKYATVGFELIFPKLVDEAKKLNIKLNYEDESITQIRNLRNLKLSKLPMDYVYSHPSTVLHSLEGLDEIDFNKILKFQSENGSFLNSPSSTAFVYIHLNNDDSLKYLESLLSKFDNAVPVNYPIDNFQRLWIIEQLTDLGLERIFEEEINIFKSYLNSNWNNSGLTWSKYVPIADLDDTSAAYKYLRRTNKEITSKVFDNFFNSTKKVFFCYPGELNASLSHLLRLFEALNENGNNKEYKDIVEGSIIEILNEKGLGDKWNIAPSYLIEVLFQIVQQEIPSELLEVISRYSSELPSDYFFETDIFYPLINFYLENKKIEIELDFKKILNLYKKTKARKVETEWIDKVLYSFDRFKRSDLVDIFNSNKIMEISNKISNKDFILDIQDFGVKEFVTENNVTISERIVMNAIAHSNFIYNNSEIEKKKVFAKYVIFIFLVDDFFDSNNDIGILKSTEGELIKTFRDEPIDVNLSSEQLMLIKLAEDLLNSIKKLRKLTDNDLKVLIDSLKDTIESMIKEKDTSGSNITFRKYLDISNKSIGVPLAIDIIYLLSNSDKSFDSETLKNVVGDIIRLCNDFISFEREKSEEKLNIFKLDFLKDSNNDTILEFASDYLYTKLLFYYNSYINNKNADNFVKNISDMLKFTVDLYSQSDYR